MLIISKNHIIVSTSLCTACTFSKRDIMYQKSLIDSVTNRIILLRNWIWFTHSKPLAKMFFYLCLKRYMITIKWIVLITSFMLILNYIVLYVNVKLMNLCIIKRFSQSQFSSFLVFESSKYLIRLHYLSNSSCIACVII